MLARDTRCSDNAASRASARGLGRAGLTSETEESTMRGCLGVFCIESGVGGGTGLGLGGHHRGWVGGVGRHLVLNELVSHCG